MAKLYHRKNEIAIDLSGIQNPRAIDIIYSGRMQGRSMLPDDWMFSANNRRIMCLCLSADGSIPELLMEYSGLIQIKGATVIDVSLEKHAVKIALEDIDYWENMGVDFDKNTQRWEALGSTHTPEPSLIMSSIVKNNLITNANEFFFADGTPYEGEYHQHQDMQAMTGAEHSEGSELIYRKDYKGNLYDIRSKLSAKQRIRLESIKKINIPKTRKVTKSDSQKARDIKRQASFSKNEVEISPEIVKTTTKTTPKTTEVQTKTTKGY